MDCDVLGFSILPVYLVNFLIYLGVKKCKKKKNWDKRVAVMVKSATLCTKKGCSFGPKFQPLVVKGCSKKPQPLVVKDCGQKQQPFVFAERDATARAACQKRGPCVLFH